MSAYKIKSATILLILFGLVWPQEAMAQGMEDILGGFDDSLADSDKGAADDGEGEQSPIELAGSFTLASAYNYAHKAPDAGKTDYRGLSRLRLEIQLDLDIKISRQWKAFIGGRTFYDGAYAINGRDGYTDQVLETYEKESEFRDLYLQGTITPSLDIKIGRQIIVWGKSDNARVTDVLNPLDNREPGMVDIEDLRLPVTATKLDYYAGAWDITAIAIHEIRFDKSPAFGSDFYPFDFHRPAEDSPDDSVKNWEYAFALNGIFSGWDISFYYADVWDDTPHGEVRAEAGQAKPLLTLTHSRVKMYGTSANWAMGNWLIKGEGAYFDGLEFASVQGKRKGRYDVLAGAEYSGINDTFLAVDIVNRHIVGYEKAMGNGFDGASEDQFQSFFRYSGDFYNSRAQVLILVSFLGLDGSEGGFGRFQVKYDLIDALSVTGGLITYQSGDNIFFDKVGNNDRLFIDLKRSF